MREHFWLILVTVYGGAIGSFVNVVIYREPLGKSLISPPSSCPKCGHRLAWFENVPVLGWLWLRGKCRHCKNPISMQYPLIEAICAALFALVYWGDYQSGWRSDLMMLGLEGTWPMLVVQLVLVAGLLAATVIDARLFIIPLRIPYAAGLVALLVLPLGAWWLPGLAEVGSAFEKRVTFAVGAKGLGAAIGGVLGLVIGLVLLKINVLPMSFDDEPEADSKAEGDDEKETKDDQEDEQGDELPDDFFYHPHPRREVLKELLFLAFPGAGIWLGHTYLSSWFGGGVSAWLGVLGGVLLGYLVGAAVIWGTRILGTLAFGREAMGLGDVHLMGAIGMVLGALDTVLAFFIAPFLGLAGAAVLLGFGSLFKAQGLAIPYGPYLAGAAVLMMLFREPVLRFLGML